jgi:hypothetical protein
MHDLGEFGDPADLSVDAHIKGLVVDCSRAGLRELPKRQGNVLDVEAWRSLVRAATHSPLS